MNFLVCDDLPDETNRLETLLSESGFSINTVVFHNGYDALDYAHKGALIDACLLDILMPKMDGVELAKRLRADGFSGEIIFLSSSNDYGSESYEVNAFSYLLKPPTKDSVSRLLKKLTLAREKSDMGSILLKTPGVARSVLLRDISYVEVIQHKVYFYLRDGSSVAVYMTFSEVAAELLNYPRFVQCHRSYIVNMDEISEISEREIVMRGGAAIPVTRTYRDVRRRYYRRVFGGADNDS
jgi:DNA-binding LytR/AlgR family response regulator